MHGSLKAVLGKMYFSIDSTAGSVYVSNVKSEYDFSYSELAEIHRIDEATATPFLGRCPPERVKSSNKRIDNRKIQVRLSVSGPFKLLNCI